MKKILVVILALALMVAVFSGCSKNTFRTVDDIKKSGELRMLTNAGFEPYEYIAGGQTVGVDVELVQMIADAIGVKLTIIDMDFDLLVDALASGKGDIIAAGMTATEARAKVVDFSVDYVNNTLKIVVPVGSDIKSFADLAGKTVAVQETTTSDVLVTDESGAAEVLRFKDAIISADTVRSGKADACVLDLKPAEGVVKNSNGELVLLDENLNDEVFAMAIAKGNTTLLDVANSVLGPAFANGAVDALVQKHMDLTTGG